MTNKTSFLRVMTDEDRMREAARMREKRLHDEASYLADARAQGFAEGFAEVRVDAHVASLTELTTEEREKLKQDIMASFKDEDGDISFSAIAKFLGVPTKEFETLCYEMVRKRSKHRT